MAFDAKYASPLDDELVASQRRMEEIRSRLQVLGPISFKSLLLDFNLYFNYTFWAPSMRLIQMYFLQFLTNLIASVFI